MELNKIYHGNALELLKEFDDESIDCVVTSPPYWNKRDYGEDVRSIWGGNDDCEHEWIDCKNIIDYVASNKSTLRDGKSRSESEKYNIVIKEVKNSICKKCGAWYGQLGQEPDYNMFIEHLLLIFDEIYRVLKPTGTVWVNLGDSYAGSGGMGSFVTDRKKGDIGVIKDYGRRNINIRNKSLIMIPERFAIGMIERGWILRNQIIWHKPSVLPESVKDRFTVDFEKIFFFTKNESYYFKQQFEEANYDGRKKIESTGSQKYQNDIYYVHKPQTINKGGTKRWTEIDGKMVRNKRTVWNIVPSQFKEAHFAVFPERLPEICIDAGCPVDGVVLDPFMGSGTVAVVAESMWRKWIGIEMNKKYIDMAYKRLNKVQKSIFSLI